MRRAEKAEVVESVQQDLGRATVAVLAEYRGLTAGELDRLRKAVRQADGRCRVSKNTLTRRAAAGSAFENPPLRSGVHCMGVRTPFLSPR